MDDVGIMKAFSEMLPRITSTLRCGCVIPAIMSQFSTSEHRLDDEEGNVVEECNKCGATVLLHTRERSVDGHYCDWMLGCKVCGEEDTSYASKR